MEEILLNNEICFNDTENVKIHAPISLNPTPFSSKAFHRATELQPAFNLLVLRTIQNSTLLHSICQQLSKSDQFISKLFQIYQNSLPVPRLFFNVNRSDYMVEGDSIYQIELNTISASLAGLSTKLSELQAIRFPQDPIPENGASYRIGESFNEAIKLYNTEFKTTSSILFIVQENERNVFDQQILINSISNSTTITIIKKTLANPQMFSLDSKSKALFVDNQEIGLVYFRAGYSPEEYKSQLFWDSRAILESSRAIKCPDIASHLAGLKKVQQVLTDPETLLQTMQNDKDLTDNLSSSFAGIYSLDATEEGEMNCEMALNDPERFVLKPQREGGGNNTYGLQVQSRLQELTPIERSAYILMDRIRPNVTKASIIRNSIISEISAVSELGIYGIILARNDQIILNKSAGYLLRTKPEESDEGGVVSGFSVLDIPALQ